MTMHNPYIKTVDVYKDGVWKCKVEYEKVKSGQGENNWQDTTWQLIGARFDYDNNPGVSEVREFQFASFPSTVEDSLTRLDL